MEPENKPINQNPTNTNQEEIIASGSGTNAQKYLDEKYPNKEKRRKIKVLQLSYLFYEGNVLEGHLDLSDFVNLEFLSILPQLGSKITKITYPQGYIQRQWKYLRNISSRYKSEIPKIIFRGNEIPLNEIVSLSDLDEWVENYDYSKCGNLFYHSFCSGNCDFAFLDYKALDNLANQALARYQILIARMVKKTKNLDFEKRLTCLSLEYQRCWNMNDLFLDLMGLKRDDWWWKRKIIIDDSNFSFPREDLPWIVIENLLHYRFLHSPLPFFSGKKKVTVEKDIPKLRDKLTKEVIKEQEKLKKKVPSSPLLIDDGLGILDQKTLEELFEYYEKLKERNRKAEINETSSKVFSLYAKTNGKYPPWYRIDQHINNIANFTVETVGDLAIETKEKVSLAFRTIYWTALILILVTIFNFFFSINAITSAIRKFFVSKLKIKADKEEVKENQRLSN